MEGDWDGVGTDLILNGALALEHHTHAAGNTLDTVGPEELVKLGVDAHVLGLHDALGVLLNNVDGAGSAALPGLTLKVLGKVDGGLNSALGGEHLALLVSLALTNLSSDLTSHSTDYSLSPTSVDIPNSVPLDLANLRCIFFIII